MARAAKASIKVRDGNAEPGRLHAGVRDDQRGDVVILTVNDVKLGDRVAYDCRNCGYLHTRVGRIAAISVEREKVAVIDGECSHGHGGHLKTVHVRRLRKV